MLLRNNFVLIAVLSFAANAQADEPFLQNLPAGVSLQKTVVTDAATTARIGEKLGGKIDRLTNSYLRISGSPIQVNAITAADAASAAAIHQSLQKIKQYPFCLRKGNVVVEYVGRNLKPSLAIKTSMELGFIPKPHEIRYRIDADLATIDKADYMSCNPLFNVFLEFQRSRSRESTAKIQELSKKFTFGRSLSLRNADLGSGSYKFAQAPNAKVKGPSATRFLFDGPNQFYGVSYVHVTMELTATASALTPAKTTPEKLFTQATPSWPANDASIKALAKQITKGETTNTGKVRAILRWLKPGTNIRYSGQTGSRWGTAKVFEQKFGHCWDFSDCFVTLCRAEGVPARQVAGWLYGSSGHVWAEFYREGVGWQQVDATGGGLFPCGVYHIPYFTSDDGEMPIVYLSMPKIKMLTD